MAVEWHTLCRMTMAVEASHECLLDKRPGVLAVRGWWDKRRELPRNVGFFIDFFKRRRENEAHRGRSELGRSGLVRSGHSGVRLLISSAHGLSSANGRAVAWQVAALTMRQRMLKSCSWEVKA